jgi:serine/threonine protein kinase
VLLKKSVGSVINEKSILEQISNPFIINMKSSFQDREYLYMTMEYLRGGDLRYHLCFYEFFNEEQTSTFPPMQNSSPAASSSASSSSTPRGSSTATSSPKTSSSRRTGT